MFDIVAAIFLTAGSLLAADLILIASRSASTIKPDWKTAVIAGASAMIGSELLSIVTWQFAAWTAPSLGDAAAGWLNSLAAPLIASLLAAAIIRKRFGMKWGRAYLASAAGAVPAFLIYSLLLGVFTGYLS